MWRASVITLYPEMFPGTLKASLIGKARDRLWSLDVVDLRDFGLGKHQTVDDTPAGGGPGMVIRPDVAAAALDSLPQDNRPRLLMTPRGKSLQQAQIREWAAGAGLAIFCARFEGIDERLVAARNLIPVSVGDYVLAGGEIAAMAVFEACLRLIPGVMGKQESGVEESFENGLLEYAQYTRPQDFEGHVIPDVLQSGNHAKIAKWRREEAEAFTKKLRPDLMQERSSSAHSRASGNPEIPGPPLARG